MARTITLRSQTHVPASARNGSSRKSVSSVPQRMSSPHRHHNHYRPTTDRRVPRSRGSELKLLLLLLLALRDAMPRMRCPALMRQRLSQPLCVCCTSRPSPATKYCSLSRLLPLYLSFPPLSLSSLHVKPTPSPIHTHKPLTHHNVYPQHTQEKERGGGAR
jgi:hypothetical protein